MKKRILTFSLLTALSGAVTAQTAWLTTGNTGNATTNFLGTKDAKDLNFKTNNIGRMTMSSAGYLGIGITPTSFSRTYSSLSLSTFIMQNEFYSGMRGRVVSGNNSANGYLGVFYQQSGLAFGSLPSSINYMGVLGVQEISNEFGAGVVGWNKNNALGGTHYGVYGLSNGNNTSQIVGVNDKNIGLYGAAANNVTNIGVYGSAPGTNDWAGYFNGRIYSADKIGINTENPSAMLSVYGISGSSLMSIRSNFSTRLLLTEDGKLGVGTPTPSSTLDVAAPDGTSPLSVKIDGVTKMQMTSSGKLGMGTTLPTAKLDVRNNTESQTLNIANNFPSTSATYGADISATNLGNGMSVGTYVASNGNGVNRAVEASALNGTLNYGVYSNAAAGSGDAYGVYGKATGGNSSQTVYGVYGTSSGTANHWAGYFNGTTYASSLRIGTTDAASGYMVSIAGKMICEEVRVALENSWPDYVFEKNYDLMPLDDLKAHLDTKKHLPGIPSADEIDSDKGYDLGDMQVRLLEKVEELTLYVIQLNEQNKKLQAEISNLKK